MGTIQKLLPFFLWVAVICHSIQGHAQIVPGAERMDRYLPLLEGKRVGVFANQTSLIGKTHLVDTLLSKGVNITVIFGPEHGFRGKADAGEKVGNTIDEKTGIPVISLYGAKRRPDAKDLEEVDIMLFDIQDVGVRFYTFISSLEEFIVSAVEFQKPMILLDRPNPNGHYVDGPVLDTRYRSFVGRQPIPTVYGLTVGEYACLLLGEKWIPVDKLKASGNPTDVIEASIEQVPNRANGNDKQEPLYIEDRQLDKVPLKEKEFQLLVITCSGYDHKSRYVLPVKPSPNLPNIQSIYLYASTCLFEGTVLSEGRGTDKPFQVFGHPDLPNTLFSFTPNPNEGAKNSKHFGKKCYGWDLSGTPEQVAKSINDRIQLKWIIQAYKQFPRKDSFFLVPKSGKMEESFFTKLSGNNELWQQIKKGMTEEQIRASWQPKLNQYKAIRKKYLLYKDFE
ncbi:MAG: exo-beta-N-acetylmuramidase NamZ domain-containing protein [Bacteroidota bacterium]